MLAHLEADAVVASRASNRDHQSGEGQQCHRRYRQGDAPRMAAARVHPSLEGAVMAAPGAQEGSGAHAMVHALSRRDNPKFDQENHTVSPILKLPLHSTYY